MGWNDILKKLADKLLDQGPTVLVLLLVLGAVGWVVYRALTRVVWPWATGAVAQAFSQAELSRKQRDEDGQRDSLEKQELHLSFRRAVDAHADTARLLGAKLDEQGRIIAPIPGALAQIDARLVEAIRVANIRRGDTEEYAGSPAPHAEGR